ncbi:unnamed protein product, partial [Laminaria digitata]
MNFPRLFRGIRVAIESLQGAGLVAIVVLILTSIIMRNFFDLGLVWIFEATGFLMVWIVFLGAPRNLIDHGEIRVDTFVQMMSPRIRRGLWLFQKLIVLLVSIVVTYYFLLHSQKFGSLASPTLKIPQILFYGAVGIGPAL